MEAWVGPGADACIVASRVLVSGRILPNNLPLFTGP
jgi:hypothetical protein